MAAKLKRFDGQILSEWRIESGHLVRRETQPTEDRILDFNAELRKNPGALNHLTFAGLELNIPELHWYRLIRKNPDLNSQDAATRTAAWRKFMASSEADPYRVRARRMRRQINGEGPTIITS